MKHLLLITLFFTSSFLYSQNPVCGFQYKKTITINGGQVTGGPHTDFPVLISHVDADLNTASGNVTSASGFDIIFADDNGNALDFQLEKYVAATGEYVAWVNVPSISNGTDVDIHMLYGKASITTDQSSTATWNSDFISVHKLHDDFEDGTANGFDGTNNGSTDIASQIADGQDFESGDPDNITIGDLAAYEGLGAVTISCWFTPESFSNYDGIVTKYQAFGTYYGINTSSPAEGGVDGLTCGVGNSSYAYPATGIIATGNTYHVSMVFDGSLTGNANRLKLYLDGANLPLTFFGTVPAVTATSTAEMKIGTVGTAAAQSFDGIIDHVTIKSSANSANWVASEYDSQNQPTTTVGVVTVGDFYTVGSEEDIYYTSIDDDDWDLTTTWDVGGSIPDGQFVNVDIVNDVDIDNNSADYTVCDCNLISTGAALIRLDLSSTRVLDVKGEFNITMTGAGNAQTTGLYLLNTSRVDVAEDINVVRSNTGANVDCEIVMENTTIINAAGDLNFNLSGGDDVTLNMDDDSDLNLSGSLNLISSGGDELRMQIDDDATLDITGNLDAALSGGDDILFNVNVNNAGSAVVNIGGNVDFLGSGGDDIRLDVEEDGVVNITGNLTLDQDGGNDLEITIDQQGEVNLTGNFVIDQDGGDDIIVNINENGGTSAEFNIGGNAQINHNAGDDILFIVDDADSELNIAGSLTASLVGTADDKTMEFNLDGGTMTAGAVSLSRSADYGRIEFDMDGGDATFASFTANSSGTLFTDGGLHLLVDQTSNFTCTNDMTITFTGADDCRFEVNDNAGTNAQFNCGGNLAITMSSGDDIEFFIEENALFNVGGNMIITQTGGEDFTFALEDAAAVDIDGNFSYSHSAGDDGLISLQAGGTCDFDVAGTFTVNNTGGGDEIIIDHNDGTMRVGSNMVLNVTSAGTTEDIDLELDGGASLTVIGSFTASLTGGDDLEIDLGNNSVASTASFACAGQINLTQNQSVAGRVVRFRLFDACTAASRGLNITHSNAAGDLLLVHLSNTSVMTIAGNIDFAAVGSGDIELRQDNTSELRISGNFDRTPGSFGELDMAVTSTLEFFGSTATQVFPQDAGAGGDIFDYGIVEINNSFGTSPQITMEGLGTVHGSIIFMDGVVSSGAGNLLVVDNGATSTGASDNSHVDGLMRKAGTDAFEFPVGDQGVWAPIEISAPGGAVNFDAEYFFADHADVSVIAPLAYRSSIEHWTLDPDAATNVDVTLHWKDAARSFINTFTGDLVVAHYDGADWESYGNDFMVAADPGEVRADGVTTFSPFTFGSLSSDININPLPVELLTWEAHKVDEGVSLDWETASEVNNSHFIIEKSEDGIHFENIVYTQGAGNSSSSIKYQELDRTPSEGWNYYRLSQYDHDGTSKVYDIKSILYNEISDVLIYPNPTADDVNIAIGDQTADLFMYDVSGKLVYQKNQMSGTQIVESNQFEKGMYTVSLRFADRSESYRLIVK